jgi:NAD(P)H-hydrate epimerase
MAQGYSPLDAARIGVYIHGLAADIYAEEHNELTLTPSVLVDYIERAVDHLYHNMISKK